MFHFQKAKVLQLGQPKFVRKAFENEFIMTMQLFCHGPRKSPRGMGKKSCHREAAQKPKMGWN